ncbi:MAG: Fe-S cluster assembly protein SufD [Bifidobacteriaceae bacterium]|nr:Fe-S cluster assembly protein SufD [Bifidobacteriaceae bacterium]
MNTEAVKEAHAQKLAVAKELNIPVADLENPYALPAAMPSSADRAVRSFSVDDFAMPTRSQDDWRFTPVERIEEFFNPFEGVDELGFSVSMADGSFIPTQQVQVYQAQMGEHPEEPAGIVSAPNDRASVVEWNASQEATIIDISGELQAPLMVRIHSESDELDALHLVIRVADKAHADVIVEHDGHMRLAEGVEIYTGEDSHISTTFIQEIDDSSKLVGNHRIHVGKAASLRHSVVTLGGDVVRIRMDQDFGGEQGDLNMLGIYFVDPGQHIEHRTMVVHNHPECKSRVIYKGALDGKGAHATWVGNALIQPTAPGTDSYELNRNLVLTPGAIADSEPNLEIENGNIVGAGHASSVGRFDDEELFYLQSRGIPEVEARKLVVRGFFGELIDEIGVPTISEHLMNVIDRRLARGENAEMQAVLEEK